jgi:predicted RNase H-like HicB family nuclease
MEKKVLRWDFRVLIQRAADVPGQWVAHCLNVDVMSQGDSPLDARDSLLEAFQIVFEHEIDCGRNPLDRKAAPQEYFDLWNRVMQHGRPGNFSETAVDASTAYIATMLCVTAEMVDHHAEIVEEPGCGVPPAWVIAGMSSSSPSSQPSC